MIVPTQSVGTISPGQCSSIGKLPGEIAMYRFFEQLSSRIAAPFMAEK